MNPILSARLSYSLTPLVIISPKRPKRNTASFIQSNIWAFTPTLCLTLGMIFVAPIHAALPEAQPAASCTYAREYITALEYFRAHTEFKLPEKNARDLAQEISLGCTGAAQRFIQVNSTLRAAGFTASTSAQTALEFASKTDTEAHTFVTVFLGAYLQDNLDLTMKDSLTLARSLTTEFHGDIDKVRKDFEQMVKFCISEDDLDLPRAHCAQMAARITQAGQDYEEPVAPSFIKSFEFLISKGGPHMDKVNALKTAEQLVHLGPESFENFSQAYSYAVSSSGLDLAVPKATLFALNMSKPKTPKP